MTIDVRMMARPVTVKGYIMGEIPAPVADGVTVLFTLANPYVSGKLNVKRDQLTMQPGVDFTETSPSGGTFTLTSVPETGEIIWCDYIKD